MKSLQNMFSKESRGRAKADFQRRVKENKKTRWVRFGIVSLIFFLWVIWMGNAWLLLFYPLLFDIYITGYIPFTWWKKSKNATVRAVMSWVDAIVYALVLVYFIFAFLGQNYMIPSSSLEKTLLTGDYLLVDKVTYGPRVPMTPIHFPLTHNTIPILNCKSYLDWPANSYHRLKGLRDVERNDIVVFNFPAGDTVALKWEERDNYYNLVNQYGWDNVNSNTEMFGKVIYRPVDRRINYVKRAIGLPGETIKIVNDTVIIDGNPLPQPIHSQFGYFIGVNKPITEDLLKSLDMSLADCVTPDVRTREELLNMGGDFKRGQHLYMAYLTNDAIQKLTDMKMLEAIVKINDVGSNGLGLMYGGEPSKEWSISNWGGDGVWIPQKGQTIELNDSTWALYNRCIRNYEGHNEAKIVDGQVYIDDAPANSYTFDMDYYFMMGDNRDNSLDSRFWGFVPEDHVVGRPLVVLASFDKDRSLFNGGIRWNRIFKDANPDK